jgi:molybdate transport system ATP-binding protein
VLRVEAQTRLGDFDLDLTLEVEAGRCLALAGPSGAGKTSALRIAAGLIRPDAGRVTCGEETWLDTTRGIDVAPERRHCGYVFQDYALFPHLLAWQNVAYGLRDVPRAQRRQHAEALLERFGIRELADARPGTLSGGERQRVAVARALARTPRALMLDEPLSALDTRTRASAARELGGVLREAEVPTLLVTHDFAEAAQLGDEVGVIDAGRIVQRGTATELAAKPRSPFVADFTGAVVVTGHAGAGRDGLTVVALDGGQATVSSADPHGGGRVALSIYPWEITLLPAASRAEGSAQNRLPAEVVSVTAVGSRVRVGLEAGQPLTAEVTQTAADELGLGPGVEVVASWKAAATRLVDL